MCLFSNRFSNLLFLSSLRSRSLRMPFMSELLFKLSKMLAAMLATSIFRVSSGFPRTWDTRDLMLGSDSPDVAMVASLILAHNT